VHSPFVYQFTREILNDDRVFYAFPILNSYQPKREFKQPKPLSEKYNRLLFRVVNHFQSVQILEIGNSLGITTTYLAAANGTAAVLNLINSENQKDSIYQNELIDYYNIIIKVYDSPLAIYLSKLNFQFDLVLLHLSEINKTASIEAIFSKLKPSSILILTHIHENVENYSCWTKTKAFPSVTCAIELYGMGFLFFRKEFMEKQYYTVRF